MVCQVICQLKGTIPSRGSADWDTTTATLERGGEGRNCGATLRAFLKSSGRESSTARDRFRNREEPFGLGSSNRAICPLPSLTEKPGLYRAIVKRSEVATNRDQAT
jgi:hypothetical protein